MTKNIKFNILLDEEGFTSFQCPHCQEIFKLIGDEVEEVGVFKIFCPKCGLASHLNNYFTDEEVEHANAIAENIFADMINGFVKDLDKSFKRNKDVKFIPGDKMRNKHAKSLYEKDDDFDKLTLLCCNKEVKVKKSGSLGHVYCPYCGV